MTTHPIIFAGDSVKAILEGRKTQTRRVVKPQFPAEMKLLSHDDNSSETHWIRTDWKYQPGDHLWVRETWAHLCKLAAPVCGCEVQGLENPNHYIEYRADTGNPYPGNWPVDEAKEESDAPRWRSPIYMARRASRLTLEITAVRVERLQDIYNNQQDAHAEGFNSIGEFTSAWNDLNLKRGYPWASNCWVWVIGFKRLSAETDEPNERTNETSDR